MDEPRPELLACGGGVGGTKGVHLAGKLRFGLGAVDSVEGCAVENDLWAMLSDRPLDAAPVRDRQVQARQPDGAWQQPHERRAQLATSAEHERLHRVGSCQLFDARHPQHLSIRFTVAGNVMTATPQRAEHIVALESRG